MTAMKIPHINANKQGERAAAALQTTLLCVGEHGKGTNGAPRHATFHVGHLVLGDELGAPAFPWHQPHMLRHFSHAAVINRCQRRTTACMCVRCAKRACRGLGSISGALSLNPLLMWPMRLLWPLCPRPHYTQPSGALQPRFTPVPLHLSPSHSLAESLHVHAHFHTHSTRFAFSCKSNNNNNVSLVLFMFIYPVELSHPVE